MQQESKVRKQMTSALFPSGVTSFRLYERQLKITVGALHSAHRSRQELACNLTALRVFSYHSERRWLPSEMSHHAGWWTLTDVSEQLAASTTKVMTHLTTLHGAASQKTAIIIFVAVRTSNLTQEKHESGPFGRDTCKSHGWNRYVQNSYVLQHTSFSYCKISSISRHTMRCKFQQILSSLWLHSLETVKLSLVRTKLNFMRYFITCVLNKWMDQNISSHCCAV
jgi:hypothetical protein